MMETRRKRGSRYAGDECEKGEKGLGKRRTRHCERSVALLQIIVACLAMSLLWEAAKPVLRILRGLAPNGKVKESVPPFEERRFNRGVQGKSSSAVEGRVQKCAKWSAN